MAEQLWSDGQIEQEMRRIGGGTRLYIDDAATVGKQIRDDLQSALDAANQRIAELESRSAHLEELLEGQEMARQSLEAKIKYLNTELQAYSNAYHRTLPPGSTRTRRKGDSHE